MDVEIDSVEKYAGAEDGGGDENMEELPTKVVLMGHDREKKKRSKDVIVEVQHDEMDFGDMQLPEDILKGLKLCRYDKPTPIQLKAIPLGKLNYDLLLQAKSGTGKTCVFTVCVLQQIVVTDEFIQAVIVTPCREIAVQIAYVVKSIGAFKEGLKVKEFIGGTSVAQSVRRISNCHVAVGTPGRLAHMLKDCGMNFAGVKIICLDEADKLMDASFYTDMKVIFKALPREKKMIATSATYSEVLIQFLETFMKNACKIQLDLDNPALCAVDQYLVDSKKIFGGGKSGKRGDSSGGQMGMEIDEAFNIKFLCLKEIMRRISYKQAIVFSNYQLRAEKIYDLLKDLGWDVDLLSASRSQEDRLLAFMSLQQGKIKALVATDVASRGIDIEGVDLVVNFDIPADKHTYLHRVGRTGRFGSSGRALSICYFDSERKILAEYQANINCTLWVIETLEEITGIIDNSDITHHTSRQLKFQVPDTLPFSNPEDPACLNWSETVSKILNLSLDEDRLEHYSCQSNYKPSMRYEDTVEGIANMEEEFRKWKQSMKSRALGIVGNDYAFEDPFSEDSDSDVSDPSNCDN